MSIDQVATTTAAELRERLGLLEQERAAAGLDGIDRDELYMRDLIGELEATRSAYVGAAVTEIATMRAVLGAPLMG